MRKWLVGGIAAAVALAGLVYLMSRPLGPPKPVTRADVESACESVVADGGMRLRWFLEGSTEVMVEAARSDTLAGETTEPHLTCRIAATNGRWVDLTWDARVDQEALCDEPRPEGTPRIWSEDTRGYYFEDAAELAYCPDVVAPDLTTANARYGGVGYVYDDFSQRDWIVENAGSVLRDAGRNGEVKALLRRFDLAN